MLRARLTICAALRFDMWRALLATWLSHCCMMFIRWAIKESSQCTSRMWRDGIMRQTDGADAAASGTKPLRWSSGSALARPTVVAPEQGGRDGVGGIALVGIVLEHQAAAERRAVVGLVAVRVVGVQRVRHVRAHLRSGHGASTV